MTPDPQLLAQKLTEASSYAYTPISGFPVGAVAVGTSGTMYCGANFEVPGLPLNQSVHAEQAAISNAFEHRELGIHTIATTHTPCGHCRQFMNEIINASQIRIVADRKPARLLEDLLPQSFGPGDLNKPTAMFSTPAIAIHVDGPGDPLIDRARKAAERSYAPHSESPSGCAIALRDGRVVTGSYLENAAYNPSLSPLHAALVQILVQGSALADITRLVLVELLQAKIRQQANGDTVLQALGVHAKLEVALARRA